jgi:Uma2 family endonuclease
MTPPPEKPHGKAVSRINRLLADHLTKSGDTGTIYVPRHGIAITPNTWLEPDLYHVSAETEAQSTSRYHTTADLVVEVISPGSAIYDRNTKADTYLVLGVKELWLCRRIRGTDRSSSAER